MRSKEPIVRLIGCNDLHPKLALTMTAVRFSFLRQDDLLVVRRSAIFLKRQLDKVSQILFLQHSNFLRKRYQIQHLSH